MSTTRVLIGALVLVLVLAVGCDGDPLAPLDDLPWDSPTVASGGEEAANQP